MNYIKGLYDKFINLLAKHKKPAYILSHGGLHFLVLIACIIGAIYMAQEVQRCNNRNFRQFSFRIEGDTLGNYKLSHVSIHITRAINTLDGTTSPFDAMNYAFTYKERIDSTKELNTFISDRTPYEGYVVDAVQKVIATVDDTTSYDENVETDDGEGIRRPEHLTNHKTSKMGGFYHPSKNQMISYFAFTTDDTIKTDSYEISAPNMTNNWEDDNPYQCCFYGIHAVPNSYDLGEYSMIMIQYNRYPYKEGRNSTGSENDMFIDPPMTIESVLPKPTELTLENIIYRGKDVEKVFEQGGVYVTAVDPVKRAAATRKEFILTVIIGIIIAFSLDIIVQLILKWRKLKSE